MTLSPAFLDELRARISLSGVISPSVKLIKAGREYKACCPFHDEKTPSFTVNDDKGFYHCFGCGAHGDAIRFLTEARGLPFIEAVKELAGKAGMEVPAPDPASRDRAERSASLTEVTAAAQGWFAEALQGVDGGAARDYLKRRGIEQATVARFGLGLAPDGRTRLKTALAHLGEERLVESGMLIRPEEADKPSYDRFRGRLMFPIRDQRGRVIGFGGRILGDGEPKYLNSPETPLFDKGRTLYNLDLAGPASRTAKRLIVVEGYMDVIALDRAGIAEVVAPNGTALTEAQLERLWRLDPSPILCFDGDSAGRKAAVRAALRALPLIAPDRTLRFVELPAGQDPDDVVRGGGKAAFEALLATAEPLSDFLWNVEFRSHDTSQPEGRASLKQALELKAQAIGHEQLKREFSREFNDRFWEAFRFGKAAFQTIRRIVSQTRLGRAGLRYALERAVLLGLSRYPQIVFENEELVSELSLSTKKLQVWRNILIDEIRKKPHLDEDALATILETSDASPIEKRDLQRDLAFSFFRKMADPATARDDLLQVISVLVAEASIDAALKEANRRYVSDMGEADWLEQNSLHRKKAELKDKIAELSESLAA